MRTARMRRCTAVALAAGVLAAAGCARSGGDRVPEGARPRATPQSSAPAPAPSATATAPPPATAATPTDTASPTVSPSPTAGETPAADAFYDPPTPLPSGKPGDLIRQRPAEASVAVDGAARQALVMYQTTGPDGAPVAATGTVALPNGQAPSGGWPVVVWDHGTTGIAAACAPSRGISAQVQGAGDMLADLVKRGYAVVQPDYVGLGVTGVKHPYLNGKSAAYSTLDMVRAAQELDPSVGTAFAVAGHSQGGHAALWTSHYQAEYAPDLSLKGVVAVAPGNGFHLMPDLVAARDATADPYLGIFLLLVDGAAAADPSVKPDQIFTEAGLAAAEKAWTTCAGQTADPLPSAAELLRPDADLAPLKAFLATSAPDQVTLNAPVFLPQGGQDPLAPLNQTLVQTLCGKGASVEYKAYPEQSHNPEEVRAAGTDMAAWIQARFDGTPVTGACTPTS